MAAGVIFDFNGTMIFDAAVNRAAWDELLVRIIGRPCTDEEFYGRIQGRNGGEMIRWYLELEGVPHTDDDLRRLAVEIDVIYRRILVERRDLFVPAPGLEALLDELMALGIPHTIASAAPPKNMDLFFDGLGLERWFDRDLVALNDGTLPGKPAPDMYLFAARKLGLPASSCVVFEDARSGIEAARRAGAGAIVGVMSQYGKDEMLAIPGVTVAVPDFCDLDGLLALICSVG